MSEAKNPKIINAKNQKREKEYPATKTYPGDPCHPDERKKHPHGIDPLELASDNLFVNPPDPINNIPEDEDTDHMHIAAPNEIDVSELGILEDSDYVLEDPDSIAHVFLGIAATFESYNAPDHDPKSAFTKSDLQMALTRSVTSLQAIFPELSAIEGGVRELDSVVKALAKIRREQNFHPTGQHRIRVSARKIHKLLNQIAVDMSLILSVQMISMGMTEKNPQWELVQYILTGESKPKSK